MINVKATELNKVKLKQVYVGGYSSVVYEYVTNGFNQIKLHEIALFGFYHYNRIKLFGELEGIDTYTYGSYNKGSLNIEPYIERLYIEYLHNEYLRIKGGKLLTPLGIWNQIYINVLKWTTSEPVTIQWFYPRFMTGIQTYGFIPWFKNTTYTFFFQKTNNLDNRYNNVSTNDFIGFQIKKIFDIDRYIGFNMGRFYDIKLKETSLFSGIFGYFRINRLYIFGEIYGAYEEEEHHYSYRSKIDKWSFYIQMAYKLFSKNYLTFRSEYFEDKSDNAYLNVITIGWNYKPFSKVVIKGEYQLFEKRQDRILLSFAVMF